MATTTQWITARDYERSQTAHMLDDLFKALRPLEGKRFDRLLDIGCGFGGLTRVLAEHFGGAEAHGIDVDPSALEEADAKAIVTHCLDVGANTLPFADGYFDLLTSFGMLDYLSDFDPLLREMRRILKPGGYVLISLPNLAGWQNRLSLLFGYQLRDVEVSGEKVVGVHPWYNSDKDPVGHIHTVTAPAFRELMEHHGFDTVRVTAAIPRGRAKNLLLRSMDAMLSRRVSLARRFFYLGRRPSSG